MPNSIVDQLGALSRIGAVLHLGAGSGLELPALLATSAQRVILVEPNAAVLPTLKKMASDKRCEVLALAVAETEGQAELHRLSFPALSSLKAPLQALTDLFPGLTETATAMVETLPLEAILARVKLDLSENNVLIIDTPGMEFQVVEMALALDPTARFAHIILRAPAGVMYEGAQSFSALCDVLEAVGYRLESRVLTDPDFPEGRFHLDPLVLKAQQLEADLEESNSARIQAEASVEASEEKVAELKQRLKVMAAEQEKVSATAREREEKVAELSQRLKAMAAEQEKVSATAREREEKVAELSQRLKAMAAEQEKVSATAKEREEKVAELSQRLETLTGERESMRKTIDSQKKKLTEQSDALNTMRSQNNALQEQLNRESANRQKMEIEFGRADAQMQLLREFMELSAQREVPQGDSKPPRTQAKRARTKKA